MPAAIVLRPYRALTLSVHFYPGRRCACPGLTCLRTFGAPLLFAQAALFMLLFDRLVRVLAQCEKWRCPTTYVLAGDGSEPVARVKKDHGIAPGPGVEASADTQGVGNHDAGSGRRVTTQGGCCVKDNRRTPVGLKQTTPPVVSQRRRPSALFFFKSGRP